MDISTSGDHGFFTPPQILRDNLSLGEVKATLGFSIAWEVGAPNVVRGQLYIK